MLSVEAVQAKLAEFVEVETTCKFVGVVGAWVSTTCVPQIC